MVKAASGFNTEMKLAQRRRTKGKTRLITVVTGSLFLVAILSFAACWPSLVRWQVASSAFLFTHVVATVFCLFIASQS